MWDAQHVERAEPGWRRSSTTLAFAALLTLTQGCSLLFPSVESWCIGENRSHGFAPGTHVSGDWRTVLHAPTDPGNPCVDGGGLSDASVDSGDFDAGRDAGLTDSGLACLIDPPPEGGSVCTRNEDCVRPCSSNWDVACFFSAFNTTPGQGVCVYADCRTTYPIEIWYEGRCPMAGDCPRSFCSRPSGVLACSPGAPRNYCNYQPLDGGAP